MTFTSSSVCKISIIIRTDEILSSELPKNSSPEYEYRNTQETLYDVSISCSGLQYTEKDPIPVSIIFLGGLTEQELEETRRMYVNGKIQKVCGEYYVNISDTGTISNIELFDPVSYPLPEIEIRFFEKNMNELYLPQWTLESTYQMNIWLDDERPMPMEYKLHLKSAPEAIAFLKTGQVDGISLDHDLGDEKNGTGYDVASFIEQGAYEGTIKPLKISIHSANPVGRVKMEQAVRNAQKYWKVKQWEEKYK